MRALVLGLGLMVGCVAQTIDGPFECKTARDCAEGWHCVAGQCSPTPGPDAGAVDAQVGDAQVVDAEVARDATGPDGGPLPVDAAVVDARVRRDMAPGRDAEVSIDAVPPPDLSPPPDAAPPPDAGPVVWPAPPVSNDCALRFDGVQCSENQVADRCVAGTCAPYACTRLDCNENGPLYPVSAPAFRRFDLVYLADDEPNPNGAAFLLKWWIQPAEVSPCGADCLDRAHGLCGELERLPTIYELLRLMPRNARHVQALANAGFRFNAIDFDPAAGAFTRAGALVTRTVTADGRPLHMRWAAGDAWPTISADPLPPRVFGLCISPISFLGQQDAATRLTDEGILPHGPDGDLLPTWRERWTRSDWFWTATRHAQPAADVQCGTLGARLPTVPEVYALFDMHPGGPQFLLDLPDARPATVWTEETTGGGQFWEVDISTGAVTLDADGNSWTLCRVAW